MQRPLSRRRFIGATAAAAALPAAPNLDAIEPAPPAKPVSISSANGLATTARAVKLMAGGEDTLEAVVSGVNIVEADPKDRKSVV